jgi:hypothetical protein
VSNGTSSGAYKEYETVYEPITEPHLSYFKPINVEYQVKVCHLHGYLQKLYRVLPDELCT